MRLLLIVFLWVAQAECHQKAVLKDPPEIGTTLAGQKVRLGGFSALHFLGQEGGKHRFLTMTDRGPNAFFIEDKRGLLRPFLLPDFSPRIVELEADFAAGEIRVVRQVLFTDWSGRPMTGLPTSKEDETPADLWGKKLKYSGNGMDSEALVVMPDGSFWVGEEYHPSLLHFSKTGRLISRHSPRVRKGGLPEAFGRRRHNRGFEALAYDGKLLWAFLQSPLEGRSKVVRVLVFDPKKKRSVGEYVYMLETAKADKLGDAVAVGESKILVIERDGAAGAGTFKRIYEVDFSAATDVSRMKGGDSLESFTESEWDGIQPGKKRLVKDFAAVGFDRAEKAEGLAFLPDGRLAVINDNDFGLDGTVDVAKGTAPFKNEQTEILLIDP
ncbi:MAG: esterase-like activity of phytase family protein [Bdellovibrionales bacterium]|nr:esterase-like activity of phytase family protein [Bdellovibrionales bacterium]